MIRVVDASAIGALIFGEQEKAWVEQQIDAAELIAPPLLDFELGNICWKKLRRFPEDAELLLAAWDTWCALGLVAVAPIDPTQAVRLARMHNLTFYDASYLWLAQQRHADVVSLDARLVRACRSTGLHAPSPDNGGQTMPRSAN